MKLEEDVLPQVDTPTFLGVKQDSRLTWKPHLEEMEARGRRRLVIMRKLSGTTWGANSKILKTVYTGSVRPVLEYASTSWYTAAKTNKAKLDKIQNAGLRTILGAIKTTPIPEMEKTANVQPLENRRLEKLLIQGEKTKRLQCHPLHDKLKASTENRLNRQSPSHLLKSQQSQNFDLLPQSPDLCEEIITKEWSTQSSGFSIKTSIPGIAGKSQQNENALRALTLEEIWSRYPHKQWTHVYTDGSAEQAIKNAGCGVHIQSPNRQQVTLFSSCGDRSSNFNAELQALQLAVDYLIEDEGCYNKVVFLSDSLSALQSLQSTPAEKRTRQLRESFENLASTSTVTLKWIPAHCGIKGNENADILAKEGGKQEQPETSMTFKESKTHIKHRWSSRFLEKTGNYKPHLDPLHCLSRAVQSTIFRLCTGHSRLRSHLKRIGVAETAFCECNTGEQTPGHALRTCPFHQELSCHRGFSRPQWQICGRKICPFPQFTANFITFHEKS